MAPAGPVPALPSPVHRGRPVSPDCPEDAEIAKLATSARLKVTVIGCGGAGSNTVHRCLDEGVEGAELCAINTDVAHLLTIRAHRKILLGRRVTGGRGAGSRPDIGLKAAEENEEEIRQSLEGTHIAFVTAGLGGGTGTGSAPVVARLAKAAGALTMGIVSLPFSGEGILRREVALEGLEQLRSTCDTTIVMENDRLIELSPHASLDHAFRLADATLASAIKGITETLTRPGLVNLDFADLRTVMGHGGVAMIGLGRSGPGLDRAGEAVAAALQSPLLGPVDIAEATGGLIHVIGDRTLTVTEAERVARLISTRVAKNARIIWGCTVEEARASGPSPVRVLIVLTGVRAKHLFGPTPTPEPRATPVPAAPSIEVRGGEPRLVVEEEPVRPNGPFAYRIRTGFLPAARRILQRGFGPRRPERRT